jgi:hypothetical protein
MLTFEDCQKMLGSRTSKKLENNTYLVPLRGEFPNVTEYGVRLHNTYVVKITAEGHELTTGGYQTATTKDRLNKYGPVRIWQRDGVWYWWTLPVTTGVKANIFKDGLFIPALSPAGC